MPKMANLEELVKFHEVQLKTDVENELILWYHENGNLQHSILIDPERVFIYAVDAEKIWLVNLLMKHPKVDPSAYNNLALKMGNAYIKSRLLSDVRVLQKYLEEPIQGVEVPYKFAILTSLITVEYLKVLEPSGMAPEIYEKLNYEIPFWRDIELGTLTDRSLKVVLRSLVRY